MNPYQLNILNNSNSSAFKYRYKRRLNPYENESFSTDDNMENIEHLINKKIKIDVNKEVDYYTYNNSFNKTNTNNKSNTSSSQGKNISNIFMTNDISQYDTIMNNTNPNNTDNEKYDRLKKQALEKYQNELSNYCYQSYNVNNCRVSKEKCCTNNINK